MEKLKLIQWDNESVVYNIESGDMHLLSTFNAKLIALMKNKVAKGSLINSIIEEYQVDKDAAEGILDGLYVEYQKINLID